MGLTALFVVLGSWSWLGETNHQSALLGERLSNWSHLLAAVSHWATVRDIPKGSGQGSGAATTICVFRHAIQPSLLLLAHAFQAVPVLRKRRNTKPTSPRTSSS